jgi:hypothetical protein
MPYLSTASAAAGAPAKTGDTAKPKGSHGIKKHILKQCHFHKRLKHIESRFCIEIVIEIAIGIGSSGNIVFFDFDFDNDFECDSDDLHRQRIP